MYVEVLTWTCHNPMCLGFLRNGHIDELGSKRIVSCSGINNAAWMWPVIGANIYHVCNYWNLVNAAQSWSGPRNLAVRCKRENPRHSVTFDKKSARDVSRSVNNQSISYILSVGNRQTLRLNWKIERWFTSVGEAAEFSRNQGQFRSFFWCLAILLSALITSQIFMPHHVSIIHALKWICRVCPSSLVSDKFS